MKKLFAILALVVLFGTYAYAGFNDPVTASANFNCKVIVALQWTSPANVTLPDVIKGQLRTGLTNAISFTVTGEIGTPVYKVDITKTDPVATGDGVILNGSWVGNGTGITLNASGQATVTYTCSSIDATATTCTTGPKTFTIAVQAQYNGL